MTPRLRMLAGPNGSGKSTLASQLTDDYAVNFYKFLNADMLFAEIAEYGSDKGFQLFAEDIPDWFRRFVLGE